MHMLATVFTTMPCGVICPPYWLFSILALLPIEVSSFLAPALTSMHTRREVG